MKTSELLLEENISDECPIHKLNKLSLDNNNATLSDLSKSLQFGVPELGRAPPFMPDESKFSWLIAHAVLDITHQIARSGILKIFI